VPVCSRYGDPLNPNGDIMRMKKLHGLVRPDGLLFLGVPVGVDVLEFNAHRIYGPKRFPLLIQGWNLVATFGTPLKEAFQQSSDYLLQPLHVLTHKQTVLKPKEDTKQVTFAPPIDVETAGLRPPRGTLPQYHMFSKG